MNAYGHINIDFNKIFGFKKGVNLSLHKIKRLYDNTVISVCQDLPDALFDQDNEKIAIWINPIPYLDKVFFTYSGGSVYLSVLPGQVEAYSGWTYPLLFSVFEHGNPAYAVQGYHVFENLFHHNREDEELARLLNHD